MIHFGLVAILYLGKGGLEMKIKELFCLFFILILSGCASTSKFQYNEETLKKVVISAEIVEVNDPLNGKLEIDTVNLISEENLPKILTELSKINFIVTKGRPQIAHGTCLKLNYQNEYELICENTLIKNNIDNEHISHKDIYKPKGFDELISNYKKE